MGREESIGGAGRYVEARENLVCDTCDDGLQFLRLGVALGERPLEVLEAQVASVKHHRVDVGKYLFEGIVPEQVWLEVGRLGNWTIITNCGRAPRRTCLGFNDA